MTYETIINAANAFGLETVDLTVDYGTHERFVGLLFATDDSESREYYGSPEDIVKQVAFGSATGAGRLYRPDMISAMAAMADALVEAYGISLSEDELADYDLETSFSALNRNLLAFDVDILAVS